MKSKTRLTGGLVALAIAVVGGWEGLRLAAYSDIVGVPTICYGETLGVKLGDKATKAECDAMLVQSMRRHEAGMRKCLTNPGIIPEKSYVSFVSLTYNIGTGAFCKSTARRRLNEATRGGKLNRPRLRAACEAASWFNKAGGRTIRGLVNRRSAEKKLCLKGAAT